MLVLYRVHHEALLGVRLFLFVAADKSQVAEVDLVLCLLGSFGLLLTLLGNVA